MKDYVRGPTKAQLIEALETLQKGGWERVRTEREPPRGRKVRRKSKP
jgi:hypothetical protein